MDAKPKADASIWGGRPDVIGTKFHPGGAVRHFPGNTVISFVAEDSPLGRCADAASRSLAGCPAARKLTFLPPSSWHMTVIPLLCFQVREPQKWSTKLPLDAPPEEVDRFMIEALASVRPIDVPLRMTFRSVTARDVLSIELDSADAATRDALGCYRDDVAARTGIRHPDHDDYVFHVSLAYRVDGLDDHESDALRETLAETTTRLSTVDIFDLEPPHLVFFDDMFEFRIKRR